MSRVIRIDFSKARPPLSGLTPEILADRLGGVVTGDGSVVCPGPGHSDTDRSLQVTINGDFLDGFRFYSYAGDDPAKCRAHILSRVAAHAHESQKRPALPRKQDAETRSDKLARWSVIWDATLSAVSKPSRIVSYLRWRGLESLFCPDLRWRTTGSMIARISDPETGETVGFLETFIGNDGRKREIKVNGESVSRLTHVSSKGVIRLREKHSTRLVVGEGIETALSAYRIPKLFGADIFSLVNAGNFSRVKIPDRYSKVYIAVDIEPSGRGCQAAEGLAERLHREGRGVYLVIPRLRTGETKADLNDVIQREGFAYDTDYTISRWPDIEALPSKPTDSIEQVPRRKPEGPERAASRPSSDLADVLEFLDPSLFAGRLRPDREWLLDGLIPMRKVTALYGDGGVGKTLLTLQLMIAVATGRPFLGREVRDGRVMAFLAENELDDTHITLDDILAAEGVEYGALADRMLIASRAGLDNVLMSFGRDSSASTHLFRALLDKAKSFKPTAVVIDTAADVFDGNEIDRRQVRRFISEVCFRLALETGAAVILCAHPSQAGLRDGHGAGGSTAWGNTVRSRLYMRRELEENGEELDNTVRVLELKKANFAALGAQIRLRWRGGVFVSDDGMTRLAPEMSPTEQRVVDEVRRAYAARAPWSANPQAGLRYIGHWMVSDLRIGRAKAKSMLMRLLSAGKIVQEEYDRHSHKTGLRTPEQPIALARNSGS